MFSMDEATQKAIKKFPHRAKDIAQSYDSKQVKSKDWLIQTLLHFMPKKNIDSFNNITIVGGWYGNILIPKILNSGLKFNTIKLIDIDEEAIYIAKNIFFNDSDIKFLVKDAQDIEFSGSKNLLINSSAEHMSTINISSGIVAIQSNDYREVEDHINCVDSAEELADQYNIRKLWFSGQLKFPAYNRFMAIGRI